MSNPQFDVTAIGNAIVDVIAQADDALLDKHKLPKGAMNLIDAETAERLYGDHGPRQGSLGRLGGQHDRGHRGARRARRPTSARSRRTSSATCSRTTSAPSA